MKVKPGGYVLQRRAGAQAHSVGHHLHMTSRAALGREESMENHLWEVPVGQDGKWPTPLWPTLSRTQSRDHT